jgi:hypothetical protein
MSYKLDPRILSKLRAFAARRRKLIIIRGIAAALAMLLATMLVVAAVDFLFVLPDEARWSLSAVAYLAVIVAEWRTCLRLLAHAPSPRTLARLVEHAEPKLREDLISAVELGTPENETVFDSPQFRGLLQQDVATRMEGVEVERLLPVNLVRRYLTIASIIVVAVIAAFIGTGFQLGTLMLRALFPGANLARVSKTQVEVLGPNPSEMLVPFGDAVPLLVKITGAPAREAWLETFTDAEGRQKVKLTPIGYDQFSGTIQVGREDLRYRVRAGDAITKKFLLDAEPRPYVVKFTKTFTLPAYAKAAPRTVTEESGDLVALEGTQVDLTLETNQRIKAAELRAEQGVKAAATIPLERRPDGKLTAKLTLQASGSYRVHLVAESTGFENKFSPEYELRAEPDLVPQIEIDQPKQDLILPANDLVEIAGHASDDIGLAKIEQHIRVNDGAWKRVPLLGESGLKTAIKHRWDLYQQGAKAGDLLTTKLVAFDLKGNRGESRPLQITVTAAGVEMKRLESLDAFVALYESLKLWRQSVDALAKASSDARQRFEQSSENDPQRPVALTVLAAAQSEFERQHGETAAILANALRAAQPGHQGADVVLIGRLVAKTEAGTARHGKIAANVIALDPAASFARDIVREADDAANRAAQRARVVDESFLTLLNSEEADLLAENAQIVQREQERLAEHAKRSGDDPALWEALGARIRVVLSETKSLENILARLGERGLNGSDRARTLAKELKKQREAVDKVIAERGVTKDLLAPTLSLNETITRVERSALDLRQDLLNRPMQVIKDQRQDVQPTWTNFEKLVGELQAVDDNSKLPEAHRVAMKKGRWELRRDLLKTHGDLEEIRPHSDAPFVGDLRAVTLAVESLQALANSTPADQTRDKLRSIDRAFRILEGVHDLQELFDGLANVASNERWQVVTPRARTLAPRDWAWVQMRLRQSPDDLSKLELREEPVRGAINGAQKILWESMKAAAFRDIQEEMERRRRPEIQPSSRRVEVEAVAIEVKKAIELLRPHAEAARQEIAKLTPKLSEYAQALAKETEKLKAETQKQEDAVKEKAPEQVKTDAAKALAEQRALSEKVESLKDLLRADANQQNIMQADQRERARDVDDALAMLKEPPPKAENALKDAAQAETKSSQEQALAQAAEQQQKLEQALNQIAKHFDALEQGQSPNETRTAMRAAEQELGIKQALDQQYDRAEQLAQMAQQGPEDLLKQLEQALPSNPVMQQELSSISQNTLAAAQQKLSGAADAEKQVAKNVEQLAKQQQQGNAPENAQQAAMNAQQAAQMAKEAAETARDAANDAVQSAKQANNQAAADQGRKARQEATEAAQAAEQAAKAAQQMAEANQPQQVVQAAQMTAQKAAEAAENAKQAMDAATRAQTAAQQAAQQTNSQQAANEMSAQQATNSAKAAEQAADAAMQAQAAAQQAAAMAQQPPQVAQSRAQPQKPAGQDTASKQNPLLANAAQQQQPIGQATAEAGAEVSRAGRHEERLLNQQAGQQLQQLGAEIGETAMNEVPAAQQALGQTQQAAQAQQPVNAAAQELAMEAGKIAQAQSGEAASPRTSTQTPQNQANVPATPAQGQQSQQTAQNSQSPAGQSPAAPGSTPAATPQEQTLMARALDMLDAALNSPPGSAGQQAAQAEQGNQAGQRPAQPGQSGQPQPGNQPPSQQGQQGQQASQAASLAQAAMQQAAQAAQQAMAQSRSQEVSPTPGALKSQSDQQAKSMAGARAQGDDAAYGATPDAKGLKQGEWGKLPKQMAEQLSRGQNEAVAAEYRNQVETYYRVIAERAKNK